MTQQSSKNQQAVAGTLRWLFILLLIVVIILALFLYLGAARHPQAVGTHSVYLQLPATVTPSSSSTAASPTSATASPASAVPTATVGAITKSAAPTEQATLALPGTNCEVAGWYVQLGAFSKLSQAQSLVQTVHKAGFPVCIGNLASNKLYRVLAGQPQKSRLDASLQVQKLRSAKVSPADGYPQYWSNPSPS
ncbi:SPOR domain-containing protein [Acidithiobacillus sp. CV18-2]|uniref:SPOR domain-containing protein n=1 Tax=Igneacidithiobacillus copahuensis TaxID=2724909 RepID=A0AAE2YP64_9PROT|nr:SPOR domain-containing protein [Igneacidithiobacillus copahuensis]MBU2754419.1 SPOR domain-containing protein [Acidithiobacillus sp. CV18-3]MBU2757558.1 SPOR domain-containing protein [Acidithiobacillus sp. BN09-2]MBU2777127.1 SPOR domain-containing protein [Acidithiobacillus sp. CV18-2]MBU2797440.1 SPOR domain-containing protein [Acidithiobacillus sp. VAN18-2]MBU2799722.1 SPOR domain-containing protein [Acidithiobacillus sp. VAN18-4]UTV81889.1 SPOR domain-containing protein [Acidithiobaci